MRKTLIALTVCLVVVSAMAAASTVSAKQASTSNVRQYDVHIKDPQSGEILTDVVGKITIDLSSGNYVANAHLRGTVLASDIRPILAVTKETNSPGHIVLVHEYANNGGNVHYEGTLNWGTLGTILSWGDQAIFYVA